MLKVPHTEKHAAQDIFASGAASRKDFTESTIVLNPEGTRTLALGSYDSSRPDPTFDVEIESDAKELVTTEIDRIGFPGSTRYLLSYRFHNGSGKECRVTVRLRQLIT